VTILSYGGEGILWSTEQLHGQEREDHFFFTIFFSSFFLLKEKKKLKKLMFSPIIEKNFFSFFSGSQCVITMFPLSSQHVIHSNSLFPYASANVALLSPI
jgi:hypothetical protein